MGEYKYQRCFNILSIEEVHRLRQIYYECNENMTQTAKRSGKNQKTIKKYRDRHDWPSWCEKVRDKADDIAVMTQAKRVARLLRLCDKQIYALGRELNKKKAVTGSIGGEIEKIARTSQLLTGNVTERTEMRTFLKEFGQLPYDEQQAIIEEVGLGEEDNADE